MNDIAVEIFKVAGPGGAFIFSIYRIIMRLIDNRERIRLTEIVAAAGSGSVRSGSWIVNINQAGWDSLASSVQIDAPQVSALSSP